MYTTFFGFTDKPFALTSDPQVFYTNPVYQRAYATLLYGLCERKDLIVFTGEVGTGKTTLLRRITQHLEETTHFLFFSYTTLPFDDIVSFICQELQVPVKETARRHQKIVALKDVLLARARQGQHTVLVIDEAQNLEEETVTALVSLCLGKTLTEPLLPIVLAGQPEFDALLKRSSLRQVFQRVTLYCRLDRLRDEEVAPYILYRLRAVGHEQQDIFTPAALQRIVTYAAGIPRKINLICDNALLLAYSDMQKTVSAEMIDEVADDFLLPASSVADPDLFVSDMNTASDDPSTEAATLIRWWTEELKDRVQTMWLGLSRRFREYRLPQLSWVEGGLVLAVLFLLLLGRTNQDVIRLTALEPAPEQAHALLPPASQATAEPSSQAPTLQVNESQLISLTVQDRTPLDERVKIAPLHQEMNSRETPQPVVEHHQVTQEQPTSHLSQPAQPEPPSVQPHNPISPQSEQKGREEQRRSAPDAHENPTKPSQKPEGEEHHIPTLLARAERQVAALRQAADLLTIEIDRITNISEEGTDRAPQGTKDSRRATLLLARAQQHEDALQQAILQLAGDTTEQTAIASARLTALLKQANQSETSLRQTTTQLQAAALLQVKAQLQEEKKRPVESEQSPHEEIVQATDIRENRQEEFDPLWEGEHSSPAHAVQSPAPSNNTQGWTPLMLAALRGDEDAVRRLLVYGAEVNATNNAGSNAFMTAALQGHHEIVRILLNKGATLNAKNDKGWTALMYAAWNGHTDIVKMLLAKGADINAQNAEGWTALMYATWKGQSETVRALLAGRATVTTLNHAGESALTVAADRGDSEIAMLLGHADGKQ